MEKGWRARSGVLGDRETYDVGADLLASDLVVDNHFVGLELRYSERFNWQRCGRNPQAWTERRGRHGYRLS